MQTNKNELLGLSNVIYTEKRALLALWLSTYHLPLFKLLTIRHLLNNYEIALMNNASATVSTTKISICALMSISLVNNNQQPLAHIPFQTFSGSLKAEARWIKTRVVHRTCQQKKKAWRCSFDHAIFGNLRIVTSRFFQESLCTCRMSQWGTNHLRSPQNKRGSQTEAALVYLSNKMSGNTHQNALQVRYVECKEQVTYNQWANSEHLRTPL